MPEPERQSVFERVVLVVLVSAAVGAFGASFGPTAWLFLLVCAISPLWKIERIPPALAAWTPYVSYAFLTGMAVLGVIFMAYPVLSAETATRLALAAGYGLSFFSVVFLLGTRVWPPARTLFPAALGILVVACFNPLAHINGLIITAAAVFAYLVWGPNPSSRAV